MNRIYELRLLLLLVPMLATGAVMAQESEEADEMEATMRLMGKAEAELPGAVTKDITLPESLLTKNSNSPAVENSADGHQSAKDAREHREQGLTNADQARQRGAEMSENAKEDRENQGRSEDQPDPPGPPENPGPPGGN